MADDLIKGTSVVWLPVSDIDRAVSFYEDTLGLSRERVEGDWAELSAGDLRLGLNATEDPSGGGGGVVAFQASGGVDAAVAAIKDKGVEVPAEPSEHPWGKIATFKDPDGNDLQFYEPPSS